MFQIIPLTFDNVIARDLWVWQNNAFDLLKEEDQERLLNLPNTIADPDLPKDLVAYGRSTAVALEEQRKWFSAQAYWLATSQLLTSYPNLFSQEDLFRTFYGIVRNGVLTTGISPIASTLEELIIEGLESLSILVQQAVTSSLLVIGTIRSTIFDELSLSNTARIALSQILAPLQEQRVKGSHNLFEESVKMYSQLLSQARTLVDAMTHATLDTVKGQRSKLLEKLSNLRDFVPDQEKNLFSATTALLGSDFTNYIKAHEDTLGDAYEIWNTSYEEFVEKAYILDSHLASCLLVPLLISVKRTMYSHLLSVVNSRLPTLKLQLLKPQARWQEGALTTDVKLENSGNGPARQGRILIGREKNDNEQEKEQFTFEILEAGDSLVQTFSIKIPENVTGLVLQGEFEWKDRLGSHRQVEQLKVERQKSIDWTTLDNLAPYSIRSIQEPKQLKGRQEQLQTLRLGFQNGSSFLVTGQKRVGKTSLMRVFLRSLQKRQDVLPLYIAIGELSASAGDDLGRLGYELVKRFLEEYEVTFDEPARVELPSLEEFRTSFNEPLARSVRQFSRMHDGIRLVFAIDDFDELPTPLFTGTVGKTLFLALRSLINNGITFFFVGSERLPAIMKEQAERLNQVDTLTVDYLRREALVELVKEPVQGKLEFTETALIEIDTWSARNPYFATLICNAIWEKAIESQDYWITEYDVREAIARFVERSTRNSYEHFWSDSPRKDDTDRLIYQSRTSHILLALSKCQSQPLSYSDRHEVIEHCKMLDKEVANLHLQELINNNIVETHIQNSNLVRIRVPLFTLWLNQKGATELERDELLKQKQRVGITRNEELTAAEVIAVTQGLSYRGSPISSDKVRVWASQFGNLDNQRLMLKLLHRLRDQGLYDEEKRMHALDRLHKMVRQKANECGFSIYLGTNKQPQNVYVTHADNVGESGSALVRSYRSINKIPERLCGSPEKVFSAVGKNSSIRAIIICVDDFIGSGHSASKQINNLMPSFNSHIKDWRDRVLFVYATIVGFEQGIQHLEQQIPPNIMVVSFKTLTEADKAFHPDNTIFETKEERQRAYDIAYRIGLALQRDNPLGWEDSQALVVFPDNIPNNTLPIFYRDNIEYNGKKWQALFIRS